MSFFNAVSFDINEVSQNIPNKFFSLSVKNDSGE
jgi:hypothetical protein